MNRTKPGDGIYHIYNRGVEKRDIFIKDSDRIRFLYSLIVFNGTENADNERHYFEPNFSNLTEVGLRYSGQKKLVKIYAFVLMRNHYHLMLERVEDDGITTFMRKLGTGYTNYFNKKYERVGALFQGKYKAINLEEQRQFIYLPYYIHLNPLEIIEPEWKGGKISNLKNALKFLETYKWSSHLDYLGGKNFPSILDTKLLSEFYGGSNKYRDGIEEWIRENSYQEIRDISLD